ncbi:GDP-mannose 4,6-dehydratase [Flavihumibacter profundi]|uniref:GDP-mannose 4,6-dehydratase n=1 Tax=Flavihumibacter profundi TaxID=2716883 RepID=UPI001CC703B6|nr:GDP-mannose 4,6-dehydratase [Flavihumibacter profundi]MBZ5857990.1 GDP-mannose 4,6-dehydratase [Flavihumibacter profundi]
MVSKVAIVTGVTGQDGVYLSKLLIDKGYKVIGLIRNSAKDEIKRFQYLGIESKIIFESCDLTDISQVIYLLRKYNPSEFYNLAAQSSVGLSFSQPIGTIQFNIISVLNVLEAIKIIQIPVKFYQASSSEMFGKVSNLPLTEFTPFHPLSPYAVSKASAHWIANNYREAFGIFTTCGILFNHESYLRKDNFFVKKVISDSIGIKYFGRKNLIVGNIDVKRDFGYAPRYVEAMWLMLQQDKPSDYLICSGRSISLRRIIECVFDYLNISLTKLQISEELFRPTDIVDIYGENKRAKIELGWDYDLDFEDVIEELIREELKNMNTP